MQLVFIPRRLDMKKTMSFLLSLIILLGVLSLCSCTDDVPLPPPPVTTVGEGVGTEGSDLTDYLRDGTDQVIENGWLGFLTDGAYIACIGSPLTFRGLYAKINLRTGGITTLCGHDVCPTDCIFRPDSFASPSKFFKFENGKLYYVLDAPRRVMRFDIATGTHETVFSSGDYKDISGFQDPLIFGNDMYCVFNIAKTENPTSEKDFDNVFSHIDLSTGKRTDIVTQAQLPTMTYYDIAVFVEENTVVFVNPKGVLWTLDISGDPSSYKVLATGEPGDYAHSDAFGLYYHDGWVYYIAYDEGVVPSSLTDLSRVWRVRVDGSAKECLNPGDSFYAHRIYVTNNYVYYIPSHFQPGGTRENKLLSVWRMKHDGSGNEPVIDGIDFSREYGDLLKNGAYGVQRMMLANGKLYMSVMSSVSEGDRIHGYTTLFNGFSLIEYSLEDGSYRMITDSKTWKDGKYSSGVIRPNK